MTVTAAQLTGVAAQLRSMAGNLDSYATAVGGAKRAMDGRLTTVNGASESPRIDELISSGNDYLAAIEPAAPAASSAAGTLRTWATTADTISGQLLVQEVRRTAAAFFYGSDDNAEIYQQAVNAIAELDTQWRTACNNRSAELQAAITAIDATTSATALSLPAVSLPFGAGLGLPFFSPTPTEIAEWWASLSTEEQVAAIAAYPTIIGKLDGVPAWARDVSNRTQLETEYYRLAGLEAIGELEPVDARALANIRQVSQVIDEHEAYTDPFGEHPVVQLYIFDPYAFDGDGRVAVSIGDLDTATHTAVTVPGLGTHVPGMGSGRAQNIHTESRWAAPGESVAVLDWIGYDAPNFNWDGRNSGVGGVFDEVGDIAGVVNMDDARAGALLLANDVAGLRAMRTDATHLTVVGNSYGSTTTAISASDYGLAADDVVLTGSPGAGDATTAADFTTGTDHTWVGSSSKDAVSYLGESGSLYDGVDAYIPGVEQLGIDPTTEGFGAQRFTAEAASRGDHINFGDHSKYYDEGSESLYNVSSIVTGNYDDVIDAEHRVHDPFVELQNPLEGSSVDLQNPLEGSSVDVQNPLEGSSVDLQNPLEGSSVDVQNPLEGSSVSAGMCDGPFGIPYPCVDVDVNVQSPVDADIHVQSPVDADIHVQSPVDADIQVQSPVEEFDINLQNPIEDHDLDPLPDDPEGERTPEPVSHAN